MRAARLPARRVGARALLGVGEEGGEEAALGRGVGVQGVDDAVRNGIAKASQTLRNLDWFETTEIRGHLAEGRIQHFQVTMKVGFRLDEDAD